MTDEATDALVALLRSAKKKRVKAFKAALLGTAEDIDPVGCGCTHCLIGVTRPAETHLEYQIAEALEISR